MTADLASRRPGRSERVKVEGGSLSAWVNEADRRDAPSILLSNGLAATHRLWDAQVAFLTRGYRVIRYDTRGHGESDVRTGPYRLEQLVGDALATDEARFDPETRQPFSIISTSPSRPLWASRSAG